VQEVAQGRVWSGKRALGVGLVDALGGVSRALQLAKAAAGLKAAEGVRVLELSRAKVGPDA
jgi:protease-4